MALLVREALCLNFVPFTSTVGLVTAALVALGAGGTGCSADAASSVPPTVDGGSDLDGSFTDASTGPDAAVDASTCVPGDVSGFQPQWRRPMPFHQGLCSANEIVDYFNCINAGKVTQCAAVRQQCV